MRAASLTGRTTWLIVLGAVLTATLAGLLVGPEQLRLSAATAGDPALAGRLRAALDDGPGMRSVVAAEVTKASVNWAGVGNATAARGTGQAPTQHTPYELGSITKTFTGSLLAEAIERKEVKSDDPLSNHLSELASTPAGGVTLASLAQHSSGLPGLGDSAAGSALAATMFSGNPYAASSTEVLLADAAKAPVNPDQPATYSNLGVSLLGTALVRAAGVADFATLLSQRITGPLNMTATTIAGSEAQVPVGAAPGFSASGLPQSRWTGTGYLPSGTSTFTTAADLARYAQAQLTGQAPGVGALKPTAQLGSSNTIGWLWITSENDGRSFTWHNGGTAGFRTTLALDLAAGRAVLLMGNAATDLDAAAFALLRGTIAPAAETSGLQLGTWAFLVVLTLAFGLIALASAIRSQAALPIINNLLTAVFGLTLLWVAGPWTLVGGWLLGLLAGPALAALVIGVPRFRSLPLLPAKHGWTAWIGFVLAAALASVGIAML